MTKHALQTRTAAETALAEQFAAVQGALPSIEREAAFRAFAAKGLPTRRDEAWHYTDLRAALAEAARPAPAPDAAAIASARPLLAGRDGAIVVAMIDGRFVSELSSALPSGVEVRAAPALGLAESQADALVALNGALAEGGCLVAIEAGLKFDRPIEIVHCLTGGAPKAVYERVVLTLGAGAEARFVESFLGAGEGDQRNAVTILDLADGAKADHATIIEDEAALHVESQVARLGEEAELSAFGFVLGGALARRQIFATLAGERAAIALSGLSLLSGSRQADTTLVVDHAAPHGQSREFYKHIIADEAVGVYQGKVIVRPGAQKTDGGMKSQALLLSPRAAMNNKPELEIFADDVVCGHGATVGALDPEQLFYLQARGLAKAEAEAMLLEAFGADALTRLKDEDLIERMREKMRVWLAARK